MLEVPSLLYQLDELLARVDFLSVGSNDLMQFFYAADRGNKRVAERFDPLSAPMLRALRDIVEQGPRARQAGHAVRRAGVEADRRARADRASATARCRCRRPPSARSRPCCSSSMPARPRR